MDGIINHPYRGRLLGEYGEYRKFGFDSFVRHRSSNCAVSDIRRGELQRMFRLRGRRKRCRYLQKDNRKGIRDKGA